MARKSKSSTADAIVEIISKLPWWISLVLAGVIYLALHAFSSSPSAPITPGKAANTVIPMMLKGLAMSGQYIIPFLFVVAAAISFFRQNKSVAISSSPSIARPLNTRSAKSTPNCPTCSAAMVMRSVKRGNNAGSSFWGCSNFPRCKGTRAID